MQVQKEVDWGWEMSKPLRSARVVAARAAVANGIVSFMIEVECVRLLMVSCEISRCFDELEDSLIVSSVTLYSSAGSCCGVFLYQLIFDGQDGYEAYWHQESLSSISYV